MHQAKMLRALTALFATVLLSTAAGAATLSWNTGVGDLLGANYTDTTTSTSGITPVTGDVLYIGNGGTGTYSTSTTFQPARLEIGHTLTTNPGDGTVILNGGTLNITAGGGTVTNSSIYIGQGANGTLQVNAGTLLPARTFVIGYGNDLTKTATFNVGAGGFFKITNANSAIYLGSGAPGAGNVGVPGQMNTAGNGSIANDLIVGDLAGSSYTQTGGSITIGGSTFVGRGVNGNSTASFSSGTFTTTEFTVFQQALANQPNTVDISGTAFVQTTPATVQPNGTHNFNVGNGALPTGVNFHIGGSAQIVSGNRFLVGGSAAINDSASNIVVNQDGGTLTTSLDVRVGDAGGYATYNLSGLGKIITTSGILVGRQGTGRMFQTGGTANAIGSDGLRIGDSEDATKLTNTGLWQISDGTINASNIALGTNGTGTLAIVGQGGTITGTGTFNANANLTGTLTTSALSYKLQSGESLTEVVMTGAATFGNGTYVVIDPDGNTPTQSVYNLLTAASITDNGLIFSAPAGWNYQIVAGGNGQILQATVSIPEPAGLAIVAVAALALQRRRRRPATNRIN